MTLVAPPEGKGLYHHTGAQWPGNMYISWSSFAMGCRIPPCPSITGQALSGCTHYVGVTGTEANGTTGQTLQPTYTLGLWCYINNYLLCQPAMKQPDSLGTGTHMCIPDFTLIPGFISVPCGMKCVKSLPNLLSFRAVFSKHIYL